MITKVSPYAVYTPSITAEYARIGHASHLKQTYAFAEADLNFLDPNSGLFHYPYALYSAGQAAKTPAEAAQKNIVSERDRDQTTVIGDSGGFQIQQGTIAFRGDQTNERMLRWLESHADFAMTLDFPTGGISSGNVDPHSKRLITEGHNLQAMSASNGLSIDYNACLTQSLVNLDYFVTHRAAGATNLLNVLQGRNERESKVWYEAVKGYGLEGWAFAGAHQATFSLIMARLLDMYEDGLLQNTKWIHILGISTLEPAYLFTTILRCIRCVNPQIGISFDSSNPFSSAGNWEFYTAYRFDKFGCAIPTVAFAANATATDTRTINEFARDLTKVITIKNDGPVGSSFTPLPVSTAIGSKVTVAEICEVRNGRLRVTTEGVWVLMNHNVEVFTKAFAALNHSFDNNPLHDDMPVRVRGAKIAIEKIFEAAFKAKGMVQARAMLEEFTPILDVFAEVRG